MKLRIPGIFLFLSILISEFTFAQTPVVLEQIQSYSYILPNADYWKLDKKAALQIRDALEQNLFKSMSLKLNKDFPTNTVALTKFNQLGKIQINWEQTASIPLHAYVELYELDPSIAFKNNLIDIADSKKDSYSWRIPHFDFLYTYCTDAIFTASQQEPHPICGI